MKVFTQEWIEDFARHLAADEVFQKRAKGFEATMQFIVQAEPEHGIDQAHACGLQFPDCKKSWAGEIAHPDYVLIAPYSVHRDIILGQLSTIAAISSQKIRVQGSKLRLLRYGPAIFRLSEILTHLDSEFSGRYTSLSKEPLAQPKKILREK